jgi:DNA-binding LytR/AlgR family response regulator
VWRVLVVDDEEPAVEELTFLLRQAEPEIEIDTALNSVDALRLMRQRRYRAIFADIQMPGLSGLEMVEILRGFDSPPDVVFVTAYDEYALKAFDLRAVDYLMKPVSPERLQETLQRLKGQRVRQGDATDGQVKLDRLPVECRGRTMLLDLSEIFYAEARDDIVYVHSYDQVYPTRFSLNELEQRLPGPTFLRVHRSFIVNLRKVTEICPYFNGAYLLRLSDARNSEITVSRGHVKDLKVLLGL